jgi:hypothetical protein
MDAEGGSFRDGTPAFTFCAMPQILRHFAIQALDFLKQWKAIIVYPQ